MMKILLLSNMGPSEEFPSSGQFIFNQFKMLEENQNRDVDFFYMNQDVKFGLARMARYPIFFCKFMFKYIFSTKKIDIIHVHFFYPNVLLAIAYKILRNWRLKIVVTFHGSDIYSYIPPSKMYRFATWWINKAIFVSNELRNKFYRTLDSEILSAGILDVFKQQESPVVSKYDLVFVGHLNHNKGIDRLEQILSDYDGCLSIVIVGSGVINTNSIFSSSKHQIVFYNHRSSKELAEIFNQTKFLINLSRVESFGLVITEAMACATPVIATFTDGANTQIKNGENGFLLDNSDIFLRKQGAKCLHTMLSMPDDKYLCLSKCAHQSAQQYKLSNIIEKLDNIYSNLI